MGFILDCPTQSVSDIETIDFIVIYPGIVDRCKCGIGEHLLKGFIVDSKRRHAYTGY